MKKIISLFIVFSLVLCTHPLTTKATVLSQINKGDKYEREINIFNSKIQELEAQANELLNLSEKSMIDIEIDQITPIYDFSGNEYTLIECKPQGYIIYHNASGIFVEGSAVAKSPYDGFSEEKYYCGPNEYYVKSFETGKTRYCYTQTNEELNTNTISNFIESSKLINSTLIANKNNSILDYIEKNQQPISGYTNFSTSNNFNYINNYEFFSQMTSPGYTTINGSGICGYIAAGMILTYEQVTNGGGIVDSSYYSSNWQGAYAINSSLPRDLYSLGTTLGYGTSTTSVAIHYTVKKYLENKGISASHTSLYSPLASN